jgi:thiol:disulfide interchange protein DsbC
MNKQDNNHKLFFGFISFLFLSLIISSAFADNGTKCTAITEKNIEDTLKKLNVPSAKVLSIAPGPLGGICEMVFESDGNIRVFYADTSLNYLIFGTIIETKAMTNLTAERAQKMQDKKRIDLAKIPLKEALVIGEKSAGKRVIIFTDPDCPYCGQLHHVVKKITEKRKDIAFYVKLYPLNFHKDAYWKSKSIICNMSLKLLEDCYEGKKIEKSECNTSEVDDTIKLAESLGIRGTPTIVLPDGRLRIGTMQENELTRLIDGKI